MPETKETIEIEVIAPSADFLKSGGISDAIAALNKLDSILDVVNDKFRRLTQGGAGGATVKVEAATAGLQQQIQSAIKPVVVPVELAVTGDALQATRVFGKSMDDEVARIVKSKTGPHSTSTIFESATDDGGFEQSKVVQTTNFAAAQREAERAKRKADAVRRARYGLEYSEFENAETQRLGAGIGGVSGTPAQRRAAVAALEAQFHSNVGGKALGLAQQAQGAGDTAQAVAMQKKYSDAMLDHAKATARASVATDQFNQSNRLIGKNMLENIKHVTTWAASVGVLYGSIRLLTRSMEENMEIGRRQAILAQIFKGDADAVGELTGNVMELAAANGQNAGQAVEAATEFARIYHTQNDILEATNSALVLANISGEEAGKTTQFLSAMTQVYKLHASELAGAIGQMAYASQNFNVTNVDLMKGLEATAESAKQAGISFSQLLGFVSAGVGATGQSGTSVGNTIKTMIQEMANPEIQAKLRNQSGIEVTQGGFGLKDMPQIFQEMFEAYERMGEAEKRTMLFNTAGRQNATRMAAILDNYVQSQVIAIQAQLNLNSAQEENEKIMATLKAQTAGLVAEWDRFVKIQSDHGPTAALTGMAEAFKNLLRVVNAPGVSTLVALMGGAVIAGGARSLITGVGMNLEKSAALGQKGGLGASTLRALVGDYEALKVVMAETAQIGTERLYGALTMVGMGGTKAAAGLLETTAATRALGFAFATLLDIALPIAAIAIWVHDINKIGKWYDHPAPDTSQVDAYSGQAGAARDKATLLNTAEAVLSNPNVSDSKKATLIKQLQAIGVDASGPNGLANLRSNAMSQKAFSADYEESAIAEQARVIAEAQSDLDQTTALFNAGKGGTSFKSVLLGQYRTGSLLGDLGYGKTQEDVDAKNKTLMEAKQRYQEMEMAKLDRAIEMGPGFWKVQAQEGMMGGRLGALSGGMSDIFNTMGTASPLDQYHRQLAGLAADTNMKQSALESLQGLATGKSGGELLILNKQIEDAQRDLIQSRIAFESQNTPQMEAMRRQQTENEMGSRFATAKFGSMAVGLTEGEQMANQQQAAKDYMKSTEGKTMSANEAQQFRISLLNNELTAQEKILELEKERHNLQLQAQRDYARSLLTDSPEKLLEKLAVGQLSKGGKMSAGSFFSLTGSAREDYMRMPGNTEAERMARRSQNALEGAFGGMPMPRTMGSIANRGTTSAADYMGIYGPHEAPDIRINAAILGVVSLGDAAKMASDAIITMANGIKQVFQGGTAPTATVKNQFASPQAHPSLRPLTVSGRGTGPISTF